MSQTEVQLIKDAVIVNADVSNSAAIDVSKISGVMPSAGGTFTGDVTFDGQTAGRDILFDRSRDALAFKDNAVAEFGTDVDLQIYHSGAHSFIANTGGQLAIRCNTTIHLSDDTGADHLKATKDGSVELYYDAGKKLETTSSGVTVTGQIISDGLQMGDNERAKFGSHDDLQIIHDGSNSFISESGTGDLFFTTTSGAIKQQKNTGENMIVANVDGAVELYHDNTKTFETTAEGATFDTGSSSCVVRLNSNTDAVSILQAFGSDFLLKAPSGGGVSINTNSNESAINCISNGAVELYHDNSKKFETLSDGVNVTGTLKVNGSPFTGGKILQVVAAETTNHASTSGSSFVDTNITANITPSSSSSKILVMIDAPFHVIRSNGTSNSFEVKVLRNGGDITDTITNHGTHQSGIGSGAISSNRSVGVLNKIILDSPSSTSQLTYKMQMGGAFSGNTVNFQDGSKSHITLMEVAA